MPNTLTTYPGASLSPQEQSASLSDPAPAAGGSGSSSEALGAVEESLRRKQSAIEVAIGEGVRLEELLVQMKDRALAASDPELRAEARAALTTEFNGLRDQVNRAVFGATFNGGGALNLDPVGCGRTKLATSGSVLVNGVAEGLTFAQTDSIAGSDLAQQMIAKLGDALVMSSRVLAILAANAKALSTHLDYVSRLRDAVEAGGADPQDVDMAKERVRLASLQARQQLNGQALRIANPAPQALMSLFR